MKYSKLLVGTFLAGQTLLLANCADMPWMAANRTRPPDLGPRRPPRENAIAIQTAQMAQASMNGGIDMNTGIYSMPTAAPGFAAATPMPYGYNAAQPGMMPMGQSMGQPMPAPSPFAPTPYAAPAPYTPVQTYSNMPAALPADDDLETYSAQRGEDDIPIPVAKPASVAASSSYSSTSRRAPRDNPGTTINNASPMAPAATSQAPLPWLNSPREIERLEPVAPVEAGRSLPPIRQQPTAPSQAGTLTAPARVERSPYSSGTSAPAPAATSKPMSIIPYTPPAPYTSPKSTNSLPPATPQNFNTAPATGGVYRTEGEEIRLIPPDGSAALMSPPAKLAPAASADSPANAASASSQPAEQRSWFSRVTGGIFEKRPEEPAQRSFPTLNEVPASPAIATDPDALQSLQKELERERAAAYSQQQSLYNTAPEAASAPPAPVAPIAPAAAPATMNTQPTYQGLNSYRPTEPGLAPVTLTPPPADPIPPSSLSPRSSPPVSQPFKEDYTPTYIPPPAYIIVR